MGGDTRRRGVSLGGSAGFDRTHQGDAITNGLSLDRDAEEQAVELFASNLPKAGEDFLARPMVPNWRRVRSAIPDVLKRLEMAVAEETKRE